MPLAITDYFETMQQRDFLRRHQYRVSSLTYKGLSFTEQDLVYLRTGEIPNRTINSVPVPFMGLQFQVPGTVQY
jgi:repressor of nif and glnA expression